MGNNDKYRQKIKWAKIIIWELVLVCMCTILDFSDHILKVNWTNLSHLLALYYSSSNGNIIFVKFQINGTCHMSHYRVHSFTFSWAFIMCREMQQKAWGWRTLTIKIFSPSPHRASVVETKEMQSFMRKGIIVSMFYIHSCTFNIFIYKGSLC